VWSDAVLGILPRAALVAARWARPLRFASVGASGVIVNTLVLAALVQLGHLPIWLAGALATEAAIISNFLLNDRWTFGGQQFGAALGRFARFNLVSLGGMGITVMVLTLLTSTRHVGLLPANLVAIAAAALWNYVASCRWTWGAERRVAGVEARLEIRDANAGHHSDL
jgi:putative flippase GtrA